MKYLARFTRTVGVLAIIIFSSLSIFFSFLSRELPDNDPKRKLISYAPRFENQFYDFRSQRIAHLNKKNDDVILAALTDETLQEIGTWPIPRTVWADLILKLKDYGAKIVAFDVIFPEKAMSCSEKSPDDFFAEAIEEFQTVEGNKVIIPYHLANHTYEEYFEELPEDLYNFIMDSQSGETNLQPRFVTKHQYPIKRLLEPGPDLAYIAMSEDSDGVFRHYQLVANVDTLYFPSFALKAFESWTGKTHKLTVQDGGVGKIDINGHDLFINNRGETKIRWSGWVDHFPGVAIHDILKKFKDPVKQKTHDEKMLKTFNKRIVIIGSTAVGAHDLRNTPVDPKTPGVYAHMNAINMLMNSFNYQPLEDSIVISFVMLGVGLVLLLIVQGFGNAIFDIIVLILISGAALFIDYKFYLPHGYELTLFFVLFSYIATYSWNTFLNFNAAAAEKKQIKGAFSRYVAPSIVDDMLDNPDKLKVGGEKRDITCMFSDVRDFTSISEMLSATDLATSLNRYMGEMTDIVFATEGTLDKYIGDAIVAFWGAPLDVDDHVNKAVNAGVLMLEALPAINEEFKAKGLPEFKIGLGLNSGECSVGNMGSDQIFAYTALGDTMNLGARLESLCKYYGAQILISDKTFARLEEGRFTTRLIDHATVKGKTVPVGVYEVLYSYHTFMIDTKGLEEFKTAFQMFIDKNFTDAVKIFTDLSERHPGDKASDRMKDTCQKWIDTPPKEGEDHLVTTMTSKG